MIDTPQRRVVLIGDAIFTWSPWSDLAMTIFPDGTIVKSWPDDGDEQLNTAVRLGYERSRAGVVMMNRHHELLHSLIAVESGQDFSPALWNVAHDLPTDTDEIRYEEQRVLDTQRGIMTATWEGISRWSRPALLAWLNCRE